MRKFYNRTNALHGERAKTTSWQGVATWYNKITERGQGHYYHQHVVIPGVVKLLNLKPDSKLLDLACGNGVLATNIPNNVEYLGVDIAPSLINQARKTDKNSMHKFLVGDVTKQVSVPGEFTHATVVLALQNIQSPFRVFQNVTQHLVKGGTLVVVLNHPAFRIPRQSSWGVDEGKKIQYRRIDKYMSPMNIPILMNPGDRNSRQTLSYHFPISYYSKILHDNGFYIDLIEEWTSDKESEVGKTAKMENRSRSEIPLFMTIRAIKK